MGASQGSKSRPVTPAKRKGLKGPHDKSLSPHGHTSRFLYLMLKQLDLKQIDWQEVADGTGLSTGRSAKSRFTRFQKHIESEIMGDAMQIKREQERENPFGMSGPVDNVGSNRSALERAPAEEADSDADLYGDSDFEMDSKKKIKLEDNISSSRRNRRSSSVVSVCGGLINDTSGATSTIKSELDTRCPIAWPLIKEESDSVGSSNRLTSAGAENMAMARVEKDTDSSSHRMPLSVIFQRQDQNYRTLSAAFASPKSRLSQTRSPTGQHRDLVRSTSNSVEDPVCID